MAAAMTVSLTPSAILQDDPAVVLLHIHMLHCSYLHLVIAHAAVLDIYAPLKTMSAACQADDSECQALSLLRLHGVCYHFCHSRQSFSKVPGMPSNLVLQLDRAALALKSIEKGEPQTPDCQPFAAQRCHLDGNRDRAQLSV